MITTYQGEVLLLSLSKREEMKCNTMMKKRMQRRHSAPTRIDCVGCSNSYCSVVSTHLSVNNLSAHQTLILRPVSGVAVRQQRSSPILVTGSQAQ